MSDEPMAGYERPTLDFPAAYAPVSGASIGGVVLFFATGADLMDLDWEAGDVAGLVRLVRKRGGTVHYPPQPPRTCPTWWRQLALAVVACVNVHRYGADRELAMGCARFNRKWYEERVGYASMPPPPSAIMGDHFDIVGDHFDIVEPYILPTLANASTKPDILRLCRLFGFHPRGTPWPRSSMKLRKIRR